MNVRNVLKHLTFMVRILGKKNSKEQKNAQLQIAVAALEIQILQKKFLEINAMTLIIRETPFHSID